MKTIFRKSTSIILALAMIIGILPMASAQAQYEQVQKFIGTENTIVYNFSGTSASADSSPYTRGVRCDIVDIGTDSYGMVWNWELDKTFSTTRYSSYAPQFEGYGLAADIVADGRYSNEYDVAFRINVPKAGTYYVSMSGYGATGAIVDVLIDGEKAGEYSFGNTNLQNAPEVIGTITIGSPGVHSLIFHVNNSVAGKIYPTHLALTPVSDIVALESVYNPLEYNMTGGTYSEGERLHDIYGIANNEAAQSIGWKVSIQDGSNWELNKALCSDNLIKDTMRIQNSGFYEGSSSTTSKLGMNIYVPKSGEYKITSVYGWDIVTAAYNVKVNGNKVGVVPVGQSTGKGADLGYVADNGCETVTLNKGINTILFEGTGNSYVPFGKITLEEVRTWEDEAKAETQVYNLRGFVTSTEEGKAILNAKGNLVRPDTGITLANGWNWEFATAYSADRLLNLLQFEAYGLQTSMDGSVAGQAKLADLVLKLNVPQTGWYKISAEGLLDPSGTNAAWYLDGVYVGEYNYCNATSTYINTEKDLRTVYVEAGTHILTMRALTKGNHYPGIIRMTAVDAAPAVTAITGAAVSDTELLVGESATVSGTVSYGSLAIPYAADITDGAENIGNNAIATVVSSDTEVVKVDGGKITAVGAGTAKITLKNGDAVSDEVTVTVTAPVEITEKETFGDVSAYITKTEEGAYNFTAFSGIDSTEYSEVGFIINGAYVPVTDNAVYKKVTVSYDNNTQSMDITPSSFFKSGASEAAYVFYSTKDLGVGFTGKVTFQPYAISADGKTETKGHPYSVTLS